LNNIFNLYKAYFRSILPTIVAYKEKSSSRQEANCTKKYRSNDKNRNATVKKDLSCKWGREHVGNFKFLRLSLPCLYGNVVIKYYAKQNKNTVIEFYDLQRKIILLSH